MVQRVSKFVGPCGHVHLLSGINHSRQGCQEEEEVSLVGSVRDTVPDASVR